MKDPHRRPTSPFTPPVFRPLPASLPGSLDGGAIATHEMFTAYVKAGFTEDQAMQLVLGLMTATLGGGTAK